MTEGQNVGGNRSGEGEGDGSNLTLEDVELVRRSREVSVESEKTWV